MMRKTVLQKRDSDFDELKIKKRIVRAVFFHKPEEPFGFLSNWYCSAFNLDGKHYTSAEQFIMHHRCLLANDLISANNVLLTNDPAEQQQLGRKVADMNNSSWRRSREKIAMRALWAKFSQSKELKEKLLATKNAYLVECAHSDTFWTCGNRLEEADRCDASKWRGKNRLGFLLMKVRNRLKLLKLLKTILRLIIIGIGVILLLSQQNCSTKE